MKYHHWEELFEEEEEIPPLLYRWGSRQTLVTFGAMTGPVLLPVARGTSFVSRPNIYALTQRDFRSYLDTVLNHVQTIIFGKQLAIYPNLWDHPVPYVAKTFGWLK